MNRTSDLIAYFMEHGAQARENGRTYLPETVGKGYFYGLFSTPGILILLQQFELNQALQINRNAKETNDFLLFSFRNVLPALSTSPTIRSNFDYRPSVQISTSDVSLAIVVQAHFAVNNIIVGVEKSFLQNFVPPDSHCHTVLEMLTTTNESYLYEEFISPQIQEVALELFQIEPSAALSAYFYRIKAEEIVYLFLTGLVKNRPEIPAYPLNRRDVQTIYRLREALAKDLTNPPHLNALAQQATMSVSKLGKLFRQIFGESIYTYYQKLRMQEAAYLLREEKLSVSEVGYQLGFTNLSHFSRLFEKHIGMKPKKYSSR